MTHSSMFLLLRGGMQFYIPLFLDPFRLKVEIAVLQLNAVPVNPREFVKLSFN